MIPRILPSLIRTAQAVTPIQSLIAAESFPKPIIHIPLKRDLGTIPNRFLLPQPSIEARVSPLPLSVFPLSYSYQRDLSHTRYLHLSHSSYEKQAPDKKTDHSDSPGGGFGGKGFSLNELIAFSKKHYPKGLAFLFSIGAIKAVFEIYNSTTTDSKEQTSKGEKSPNQSQSGTSNTQLQQTGDGENQHQQSTGSYSPIAGGDLSITTYHHHHSPTEERKKKPT